MTHPFRNVAGVILLIIFIASVTFAIFSASSIISQLWIPITISVIFGILTILPLRGMWRWLTGSSNYYLIGTLNILLITPIAFLLILSINGAVIKESAVTDCTVSKIYTKTRHQSKRVGRNRYVQGAPYKVYFMHINSENGLSKDIEITHGKYNSLNKGDTLKINVNKGLLGISFFDRRDIKYPAKNTAKNKFKSAREKRHEAYRKHINKVLKRNEESRQDR